MNNNSEINKQVKYDSDDDIPPLEITVNNVTYIGPEAIAMLEAMEKETIASESAISAIASEESITPVATAIAEQVKPIKDDMINIPLLEKGQNIFNFVVHNLFMEVNNLPFSSLFGKKKIKGTILNPLKDKKGNIIEIRKERDLELVAGYLKGGMAYKGYDRFLTLKNDIDIKTPKTIDYDIVFCVNILDYHTEKLIVGFIIDFMNRNYEILNDNKYIDTNFDNIDDKVHLDENEILIRIINNKLLITLYKYPPNPRFPDRSPPFISLRISLSKNAMLERIFDITFTIEREPFEKVNNLNILEIDIFKGYSCLHIVPDITSLLKMSLVSLINRGTTYTQYKKCKKDYLRSKYLIDLVESLVLKANSKAILGYVYGTIRYKLEYIISILPHCEKSIDESDVKSNYFDKFVGNVTVREIIREIIFGNLKTKELEDKKRIINTLLQDNNVTEFLDRHKHKEKYLKYKQKYIELKKILNKLN